MCEPSQAFLDANQAAAQDVAGGVAADGARVLCPFVQRRLRVVLKDADFLIYRDIRYTLTVDGVSFAGSTPEQGVIDHLIPKNAKKGTLTVWIEGDAATPVTSELDIALIDPLSLATGAKVRFENLQFDRPDKDEAWPAALKGFQEFFDLEQSSQLDDPSQSVLRELYSAKEDPATKEALLKWRVMLCEASQQQSSRQE
ncbi:hypothetical protein RugamoR57_07350 [Duganella caerulea]|uniref:hypothetical protein n=1 Tax=Duganella caerulea TaxID=2885762 RepID=UPI0030E981A6